MNAYVVDCDRAMKRSTVTRIVRTLDLFLRFAKAAGITRVAQMSRQVLADFNAWLARADTSLHGKDPRAAATIAKNTAIVQRMWWWWFDADETGKTPPPKKLRMPAQVRRRTMAPTWAEMDACIAACRIDWHRQLATLLRFTGLRVSQALALVWADFDLERGELHVRPELGKSAQEMTGRVVPISPHLVAILAGWGRREGFVVQCSRSARLARPRDLERAWARAEVRKDARRQPHHAFRKGFVSELKRLGADNDAVEVLVGHSLGLRGVYTDSDAIPLRAAVALIPPLAASNVLQMKAREA